MCISEWMPVCLCYVSCANHCEKGMCECIDEEEERKIILLEEKEHKQVVASKQAQFFLAAKSGNIEMVDEWLVDSHVDPTIDHDAALEAAVTGGHPDIVEMLLLDGRCNPGVGVLALIKMNFRQSCSSSDAHSIAIYLVDDDRVDLISSNIIMSLPSSQPWDRGPLPHNLPFID